MTVLSNIIYRENECAILLCYPFLNTHNQTRRNYEKHLKWGGGAGEKNVGAYAAAFISAWASTTRGCAATLFAKSVTAG
jgi:hypothetical protein